MIRRIAILTLVVSAIFSSSWLYWGSNLKLKQEISSREWQSKTITELKNTNSHQSIGPLSKVDITSHAKYLRNGTYSRDSRIILSTLDNETQSTIIVSETGNWDISDNYLMVSRTQFKNISQSQNSEFTQDELELITNFFEMEAEQSRRIDIVNNNTLLLTNLNHGSTVLFSN